MTETILITVQTVQGIWSRVLDVTGLTDQEIDAIVEHKTKIVFNDDPVISIHWEFVED